MYPNHSCSFDEYVYRSDGSTANHSNRQANTSRCFITLTFHTMFTSGLGPVFLTTTPTCDRKALSILTVNTVLMFFFHRSRVSLRDLILFPFRGRFPTETSGSAERSAPTHTTSFDRQNTRGDIP